MLYPLISPKRKTNRLFFARDPLGRRSLLVHRPSLSSPCLILSSVSAGVGDAYNFEEVDPQHIHYIDLDRLHESVNVFKAILGNYPSSSTDATLSIDR